MAWLDWTKDLDENDANVKNVKRKNQADRVYWLGTTGVNALSLLLFVGLMAYSGIQAMGSDKAGQMKGELLKALRQRTQVKRAEDRASSFAGTHAGDTHAGDTHAGGIGLEARMPRAEDREQLLNTSPIRRKLGLSEPMLLPPSDLEPQERLVGTIPSGRGPLGIWSGTLWIARCMWGESNRHREQELVAWVIRNRKTARFQGEDTYRGVVLHPGEFSPFNKARLRSYLTSLDVGDPVDGWQLTLRIARHVRRASEFERPFPDNTWHFYSQQSMPGFGHPEWAFGERPVIPRREWAISSRRFRFFAGLAEEF